jgi:hypothetical protein
VRLLTAACCLAAGWLFGAWLVLALADELAR